MPTPRHILVAVAWPYASGSLHLGHLGGAYLPPDIFARYHRLASNRVLMVSGSDTHGTPITVKAEQEGVGPADIVNRFHPEIVGYWESLGISFDHDNGHSEPPSCRSSFSACSTYLYRKSELLRLPARPLCRGDLSPLRLQPGPVRPMRQLRKGPGPPRPDRSGLQALGHRPRRAGDRALLLETESVPGAATGMARQPDRLAPPRDQLRAGNGEGRTARPVVHEGSRMGNPHSGRRPRSRQVDLCVVGSGHGLLLGTPGVGRAAGRSRRLEGMVDIARGRDVLLHRQGQHPVSCTGPRY